MNRFEQAVHDCMIPTAELLEVTTKPRHRAILLNFWRHVHLEGAGEYERIVAPDMMVDEPVYRVTWGASPAVITGKDGVLAFYRSVGESVLWHSDDRLAVGDWGVCDEITFHQLARGADLRAVGYASPTRMRCTTRRAAKRSSGPTTPGRASPASTCTRTRRASSSRRSLPRRRSHRPGCGRSTGSSSRSSRPSGESASGS